MPRPLAAPARAPTNKCAARFQQAQLTGSAASVGNAKAQIAAAMAGLKRAEADASKAELDLTRVRELRASNVIPRQRLDDAKAATWRKRGSCRRKRTSPPRRTCSALPRAGSARRAAKVQQSSPVAAQIAAARANAHLAHARVLSAQAALELARLQLSYTKIFGSAPASQPT
jgi:membrane fusion protein (multidrug efflux system)